MFPTEAEQIQSIIEAESAQAAPFAFSLPQEDIDHLLRLGSNTEQARLKIVNEFMKQKPFSELTAFVKQTYHDGYGLKTGNGSISSWADEDGLHITRGTSVRYARNAQAALASCFAMTPSTHNGTSCPATATSNGGSSERSSEG